MRGQACGGRTLAHAPRPLPARPAAPPAQRTRPKSTTRADAPGGSGERAGGAGRGSSARAGSRFPGPSPGTRAARPLADKRVYRPRFFSFPGRACAAEGSPLASGLSLRSAVYITGRYVNPPGALTCALRAVCLKACHCACSARAYVCGPRRGCGPRPTRAARSCQAGRARGARRAPRAASPRAQRARGRRSPPLPCAARAVPRAGTSTARRRSADAAREATHGA